MTAVRDNLINAVLGSTQVDPRILSVDEWYEILARSSNLITAKFLRRMRTLRDVVLSGDRPSGIPSNVDDAVLAAGLPTVGFNPNTAFLLCAHVSLRPDSLPGEAKHILMSRDLVFYELTILWNMTRIGPEKAPRYEAEEVVLVRRDLRSILADYVNLEVGIHNQHTLPTFMITMFELAQRDTVESLESELAQARDSRVRLANIAKSLRKPREIIAV